MIYVALGANLPSRYGTPDETLMAAKKAMNEAGIRIAKSSQIWLTAPVPISDQPWYHNAVVQIETGLDAFGLLGALQKIENEFGRVRTVRNAPRVLDLDLVAYHDQIIDKPELIVPHPRMQDRAFVLMPLREIAPVWTHPISGLSIDALLSHVPEEQKAVPMNANDDAANEAA